jgi:hypothetical protein
MTICTLSGTDIRCGGRAANLPPPTGCCLALAPTAVHLPTSQSRDRQIIEGTDDEQPTPAAQGRGSH